MASSQSLGIVSVLTVHTQGMESWFTRPVLEFHKENCVVILFFLPFIATLLLMILVMMFSSCRLKKSSLYLEPWLADLFPDVVPIRELRVDQPGLDVATYFILSCVEEPLRRTELWFYNFEENTLPVVFLVVLWDYHYVLLPSKACILDLRADQQEMFSVREQKVFW